MLTVQAIIDAGFICLQRYGMAGTTTNHLAQVAGVSPGTLYEYFSNKEAVYAAMMARFQQDLVVSLQEVTATAARLEMDQAMRLLAERFLELLQRDNGRYLHLLRHLQHSDLRIHTMQLNRQLMDLIVQYLVHHPQFTRLRNLHVMSYIVINSGVYNLIHHQASDDPPVTLDELVDGLIDLVTGYIHHDLARQDAAG